MKGIIASIFFSLIFLILSVNSVSATDAFYELRSTDSNSYRCWASALQMQNLNYLVSISCREIVFPLDTTIYSYILWANPSSGGTPVKIGSIGLGRANFSVKQDFTSLFITGEQNANTKTPTGNVVMKGSIQPVTFLESAGPSGTTPGQTGTPAPSPAQTQKPSLRDRIITGLKRAGLATGLALVAIFGLVFVLTRPK